MKQLAATLVGHVQAQISQATAGQSAELGTITSTGGLKLDSFPHEIPEYLVADWLVNLHLPPITLTSTNGGQYHFEETVIEEVRVNLQAGLRPGDRVLVEPVLGGKEFVVVSRLVSSNG